MFIYPDFFSDPKLCDPIAKTKNKQKNGLFCRTKTKLVFENTAVFSTLPFSKVVLSVSFADHDKIIRQVIEVTLTYT